MSKKTIVAISIIFLVFITFRIFVLPQIYHQDEYKWAMIADPSFGLNLESDHPPLVALLYRATGFVFGFDNLRFLPFLLSLLNLALVYLIAKKLYGKKAAILSAGILAISVYSILGSTQIDIDGTILPLTFLLSVFAYINGNWDQPFKRENRKWTTLLVIAFIFGFSVKLSFVLATGAIATDYIFSEGRYKKFGEWFKAGGVIVLGAITAFIFIEIINKLLGIANSGRFLSNAGNFGFLNFGSRNYFQVLFLGVKSLILASPLLVVPLLFVVSKFEYIKKFRLWLIFIAYNLLFYFVIFDFTSRTIERYMMFLVIPCAIVAGVLIAKILESNQTYLKKYFYVFSGSIVSLSLIGYLFWRADLEALPLNPKSAYLDKIFNFDFNFLIPITGGSGPVGFYVPVSFIILFFVLALIALIFVRFLKNTNWQTVALLFFFVLGLVYNGFMIIEYSGGMFYGSVDKVAKDVMREVATNENISKVITYYDYGGYELNRAGKYQRRFYTDPMFAENTKKRFAESKDVYAVIDFPEIDKNSFYWEFLKTCKSAYGVYDKKISGYIIDCRK